MSVSPTIWSLTSMLDPLELTSGGHLSLRFVPGEDVDSSWIQYTARWCWQSWCCAQDQLRFRTCVAAEPPYVVVSKNSETVTVVSEMLARGRDLVMLSLRILWYHLVSLGHTACASASRTAFTTFHTTHQCIFGVGTRLWLWWRTYTSVWTQPYTCMRPILVRCDLGMRVRWRTWCGLGVKKCEFSKRGSIAQKMVWSQRTWFVQEFPVSQFLQTWLPDPPHQLVRPYSPHQQRGQIHHTNWWGQIHHTNWWGQIHHTNWWGQIHHTNCFVDLRQKNWLLWDKITGHFLDRPRASAMTQRTITLPIFQ